MGAKKLHNLFSTKEKVLSSQALKKSKTELETKEQAIKDKAAIESYTKAIQEKLKDPEMAKKAAQILEQMLKK